jgi:hypothetical protein
MFQNPRIPFDWVGSPREILQEIERAGLTPAQAAADTYTQIAGAPVYKDGRVANFHGGSHAQGLMHLLDALGVGNFHEAARLLDADPQIVQGVHDGAVVPLSVYTALGTADAVRFLISRGAPVNGAGLLGMTPLHWAAAYGKVEIAQLLLAAGADPRQRNWFLLCPAHLAHANRHPDLAQLLAGPYGLRADFGTPKEILREMGCG